MNLGKATLLRRGPRGGGGLTAHVENNLERLMDSRIGYGRLTDGGYGPSMTTIVVQNTNPSGDGSLAAAMAANVDKYIVFKPGLSGDIGVDGTTADSSVAGVRVKYMPGSRTIVDGTGFSGLIYGSFVPQNATQLIFMYCSVTQPFPYGGDPSGPVISASNCDLVYYYHCTVWDSGDVLYTGGRYQLTVNDIGHWPTPYRITVDSCLLGPNPGRYAMMSPIRGSHPGIFPGDLNAIDGDARNGKCMESSYDHDWIFNHPDAFSDFDRVVYTSMINNVLNGCIQRNLKVRSENLHAANNIVAKFGATYNLGGGPNNGGGTAFQDDALGRWFGNVYIPYKTGEAFVGFQSKDAVPLGKTGLVVSSPTVQAHQRLGANTADTFFGGNYIPTSAQIGYTLTVDAGQSSNGLNYQDPDHYGYSYSEVDVSNYTAAKALVKKLCDDAGTKAGNPYCAIQPPSWRDVDTTNLFPVS